MGVGRRRDNLLRVSRLSILVVVIVIAVVSSSVIIIKRGVITPIGRMLLDIGVVDLLELLVLVR